MSALPITPLSPSAPGAASARARTTSRLVVAARSVAVDGGPPRPMTDDVVGPVGHPDRSAGSDRLPLGPPLGPRTRAQALRRRVVALVAAGVVVAAFVVVGLQLGASSAGEPVTAGTPMVPASVETVVVRPGQTLWSIASARRPAGVSTADYTAMIVEHNGLAGGTVDQWQVLLLPTP